MALLQKVWFTRLRARQPPAAAEPSAHRVECRLRCPGDWATSSSSSSSRGMYGGLVRLVRIHLWAGGLNSLIRPSCDMERRCDRQTDYLAVCLWIGVCADVDRGSDWVGHRKIRRLRRMDLNMEKNASCILLGDLFQHVVTDMKVSKMFKTYNCLRGYTRVQMHDLI